MVYGLVTILGTSSPFEVRISTCLNMSARSGTSYKQKSTPGFQPKLQILLVMLNPRLFFLSQGQVQRFEMCVSMEALAEMPLNLFLAFLSNVTKTWALNIVSQTLQNAFFILHYAFFQNSVYKAWAALK